MNSKTYTSWVDTDIDGSYYIIIPDELFDDIGWKVGDNIKWVDNNDGSFSLRKINE